MTLPNKILISVAAIAILVVTSKSSADIPELKVAVTHNAISEKLFRLSQDAPVAQKPMIKAIAIQVHIDHIKHVKLVEKLIVNSVD